MIPKPTFAELSQSIYNKISAETPLVAGLEATIVGTLVKTMAAMQMELWDQFDLLQEKASLSTATGTDLDTWGILFNTPRRTATSAGTLGLTRAVRFTNTGGVTVNIPAGTRVFKESDPQVAFLTVEGASLNAGASEDLHVTAANVGPVYNVAIGEINNHNIPAASVVVSNILPITNGSLQESDDAYRERILSAIRRRKALTPANTIALLRQNPLVRDVFLLDQNRGQGTFDVIIVPHNYSDISAAVEESQRLLDDNVLAGISAFAIPPEYRQLDVNVRLRFATDVAGREEAIRESIRSQIKARVDNLPIEDGTGIGTFFTSIIEAVARTADRAVLDAVAVLGLDGSPISSEGELRLNKGERLLLRSLSVE